MKVRLHQLLPLVVCVSTGLALSGCETMLEISEGVSSALADENAKRQDDPAAYRACERAYQICKANGGFGTTPCEEQRTLLMDEGIYCLQVGVTTGTRAR
jgi:hypothetical protein